jgi:hypothetical protein
LSSVGNSTTRRGRSRRRSVLEYDLSPALKDLVGNVQLPVNSNEECHLVLVDLLGVEARNLAPGACRVVAVLKVLRRKDKSREEHTATALKGTIGSTINGLLHGKVMLGDVGLDQNKVIQSDLEGRVACARAA